MAGLASSYIGKKYGNIYKQEIDDGDALRQQYANQVGASDSQMNDADFNAKTTIGYTKQKGQVSTDEPPVDIAPDTNKMMNAPVYKALMDEKQPEPSINMNRNPAGVLDPEYNGGANYNFQKDQPTQDQPVQDQPVQDQPVQDQPVQDQSVQPQNTPRQTQQVNNATGDMMVGASHALLALLGGNANRSVLEYGKANQYEETQRAQDIKNNSNLVMTVGPDGVPVYTPKIEAPGETPFIKPLRPGAAGLPKPTNFYNPDTKQVEKGSFNPLSGKYSNASGKIIEGAQEYIPTQFREVKTAGGTSQFIPLNPVTGNQSGPAISGPEGEAASKGQGSDQYKNALDLSKQFPKEIAPLQQQVNYGNASLTLMASKDPKTQALGMVRAQQYLQDAKKDQNVVNIISPGMFDKWTEMATRAVSGRASATEVNELQAGVQQIAKAQKDSINSMGAATTQAAGPEAAQMMNQNIYKSAPYNPPMPTIPASEHPDAKAAARWANGNINSKDPETRAKAQLINETLGR